MSSPLVAIVVPTRDRPAYLKVSLVSLAEQDLDRPYEVLVVDDGTAQDAESIASHANVTYRRNRGSGLNGARNTGVLASNAPLVAFVDDDVYVPPSWLRALVRGAERHEQADVFGGPIRARFEGQHPRSCGREAPPITTLDLGPEDIEADMVWGANMAIRREAFDRFGLFDETIVGHGDEEDWLSALKSAGGRIVYLADASVDHRRVGPDARLFALTIAAYHRGRAARVSDERRASAPPLLREVRTVGGCGWHTVRYRCPQGIIMGAHSLGRLATALRWM